MVPLMSETEGLSWNILSKWNKNFKVVVSFCC